MTRSVLLRLCCFCLWLLMPAFPLVNASAAEPGGVVTIGTKNFTEQYILGEILAQTIEETTDLKVNRRFNMGGTSFVFNAIRTGAIDIYPEYTGTAWMVMLNRENPADPDTVYPAVSREYRQRYGLIWGKPFGFNNTYAVTVRGDDKRLEHVETISQLAPLASELKIGLVHEYMDRADGFPHLRSVYDLSFQPANMVNMEPGLMYTALRQKDVDVIVAYSTDGRIRAFNLKILEDDRHANPPYEAAPVIRAETLKEYPELKDALDHLSGLITDEDMIEMNYQVDSLGRSPDLVASNFLTDKGVVSHRIRAASYGPGDNFFLYAWSKRFYLLRLLQEHFLLTVAAMVFATSIAVPAGILLTRFPRLAGPSFAVVNLLQTIPSLALLGFLIPVLGIGVKPAIAALFIYALLPLVRNTYIGIWEVDAHLKEATRGLGLTDLQILQKVELPLALPTIMGGVRTSTVIVVGTATLAALIGAGGLGDPIFRGISSVNTNTILLGAIPAALLAIALDGALHLLEKKLGAGDWRP